MSTYASQPGGELVDEPKYGPGDRVSVRFQPECIEVNATVIEQRGGLVDVTLDDNGIHVTVGASHLTRHAVERI